MSTTDPVVDAARLEDLASRAGAGEERAAGDLLAVLRPRVLRYCLARLSDRYEAEDVTQEVCAAVVPALARRPDPPGSPVALAFGIAAHKVADAHRARGRRKDVAVQDLPDAAALTAGPEDEALRTDDGRRLARLLEILPETQRHVLTLRVVAGLSAEETAAVVKSTPGAVRVAQHRALARLRRAVAEGADAS